MSFLFLIHVTETKVTDCIRSGSFEQAHTFAPIPISPLESGPCGFELWSSKTNGFKIDTLPSLAFGIINIRIGKGLVGSMSG